MAGVREIWRWKFRAAVFGAPKHAKARNDLLAMLRVDYPLMAEDKAALAEYIEELTRKRTKKDKGKRKGRVAYEIECFRQAKAAVRAHRDRFRHDKDSHYKPSTRDAIDDVCDAWNANGSDWARKYRGRLIAHFKITERKPVEPIKHRVITKPSRE